MTAAAKPAAGDQRPAASAEQPIAIAVAGLNEALARIDHISALARAIQGLLPNDTDSDQAAAVVEALVDVTGMASNGAYFVLQRLGDTPPVTADAAAPDGANARTADTSMTIGKQPVAADRAYVAWEAGYEITRLAQALDRYGDQEVPPEVMRLFVHRINRLGCAILSALSDELDTAAAITARTFPKTCVQSEVAHG